MVGILNLFFNKKSSDSSPWFQGVVNVSPRQILEKTQFIDVAVSVINTSLPICTAKEIAQTTAVAIYKHPLKETAKDVVKRIWSLVVSKESQLIQDSTSAETGLSLYHAPVAVSQKIIRDIWNSFLPTDPLSSRATDQGLRDLSQLQQVPQSSCFSWIPSFKSSAKEIIHEPSYKISQQKITAALSDKNEDYGDILNTYGKYILSGILTVGACFYFYKKISSFQQNKRLLEEEELAFQGKIREVVNSNMACNSRSNETGPVTTSPITTSPVTTSPITTSPITTSPITTSPITTSPITTSPVTTSPVTTSPVTTSPVTTSPLTTTSVPSDDLKLKGSTTSNASLTSSLIKKMFSVILSILKAIRAVFNIESLFFSKDSQRHNLYNKI